MAPDTGTAPGEPGAPEPARPSPAVTMQEIRDALDTADSLRVMRTIALEQLLTLHPEELPDWIPAGRRQSERDEARDAARLYLGRGGLSEAERERLMRVWLREPVDVGGRPGYPNRPHR